MVKYEDMIDGKEYRYGSASMPYKKEKGILYYPAPVSNKWLVSGYAMREIAEMLFEEIPWEPEYDDEYYFPLFISPKRYFGSIWRNDGYDEIVKKVVGCYKTPEEAQAKARELGWLE